MYYPNMREYIAFVFFSLISLLKPKKASTKKGNPNSIMNVTPKNVVSQTFDG